MDYFPTTTRTKFVKLHRHDIRQSYSLPSQPRSNVVRVARIQSFSPQSSSNDHSIIEDVRSLSSPRISFVFDDMVSVQHSLRSKPRDYIVENELHHSSNNLFIYDQLEPRTSNNIQQPTIAKKSSIKVIDHSIKDELPSYYNDIPHTTILPKTSTQNTFHLQPNMKIIHEAPSVNHLVRRKLIFNDKKEKIKEHGKRRRNSCFTECCACCSLCCCLISSLILILLLVAGIITLLVLLLTNRSTTNPDTTVSIITTDTTIQINTTTVTTSTITSVSKSMTTTSTSSTSTTSFTTASTSTTSTVTSTSTTSITTITTSTTAATVTITSNTCTSGWKGVTLLYHCDNCPDIAPYKQYNYTYTAISNQTRIAFSFREDAGCFALDYVSVRSISAPTIELIANNDFETGTLSSWTYCNPQSATSAGEVKKNSDNFNCMGYLYQAKSGSRFYYDGAVGNCDYLIQTFATDIGSTYLISYWLYNRGVGSASSADVIISI